MTDAWALIIATLITTLAGGIGAALKQMKNLREENRLDHGMVMLHLKNVKRSVDSVGDEVKTLKSDVKNVGDRLADHIDWHLKDK